MSKTPRPGWTSRHTVGATPAGCARHADHARVLVSVLLATLAALSLLPGPAAASPATTGVSSTTSVAAAGREPPDVVGLGLSAAQDLIAEQWYPDQRYALVVRVEPEVPDTVPPEATLVVAQLVEQYLEDSDDVRPSATIVLTVGSSVADLIGRTAPEAEELLDSLGLVIRPRGEGRVIRQSVAPGELVPFRTVVAVDLAPVPDDTRTVPDLLGLTAAQARAAVEGVDLTMRVEAESGDGEQTVSAQDPPPQTTLEPGDAVSVTLLGSGTPLTMTLVPDVTGLEPRVVAQVLDAAGLPLRIDPAGAVDEGLSFRQDPEPGQRVAPGTAVTVAFAVVTDDEPAAWLPVAGVAAVVLLLLALVLWAVPALRSAGPRPAPPTEAAPPEVVVEPHPDSSPTVSVESTGADEDLVLRVLAIPEAGRFLLEEEPR